MLAQSSTLVLEDGFAKIGISKLAPAHGCSGNAGSPFLLRMALCKKWTFIHLTERRGEKDLNKEFCVCSC